jgi:hypothetical protein
VSVRLTQEDDEKRHFMFDSLVANTSLQEDLLSQLRLSELNEDLYSIAEMLIGNIDDHGYLQASVDELASATNIPQEKILEVLKVIQSFDPPVPARVICASACSCNSNGRDNKLARVSNYQRSHGRPSETPPARDCASLGICG